MTSRELIADDDPCVVAEVAALKATLVAQRSAACAAELQARADQMTVDAHTMALFQAGRARNMNWEAWSERWSFLKAVEAKHDAAAAILAGARLELEASEDVARERVSEAEETNRLTIGNLEREKRKHLLESAAWVSDWERGWAARNAQQRAQRFEEGETQRREMEARNTATERELREAEAAFRLIASKCRLSN